jgi:hypothetical protein
MNSTVLCGQVHELPLAAPVRLGRGGGMDRHDVIRIGKRRAPQTVYPPGDMVIHIHSCYWDMASLP